MCRLGLGVGLAVVMHPALWHVLCCYVAHTPQNLENWLGQILLVLNSDPPLARHDGSVPKELVPKHTVFLVNHWSPKRSFDVFKVFCNAASYLSKSRTDMLLSLPDTPHHQHEYYVMSHI